MKALIAALLCGVAASAQEVVWERTGGLDQYELGRRCQFIGDVDGDGYDDLVTSVRRVVGTPPRSHVDDELWILSGRDGSTLRTRGRYNTGDADRLDLWLYGGYGAAGDMDRDGRPDYFFGAWESSGPLARYIIEVRDGRDDRLILRFVRSSSSSSPNFLLVNLLGHDLNGDGHTDLIGRARGPQHLGLVQAYSHTGTLLWETHGTNQLQFDTFDGNEAWVGDVDGDGVHDFVVGGYDRIADALAAVVLSGRTGQPVVVGHSLLYYGTLGFSLDGCGDVDGDGVPDFAGSGVSSPARSSVQLFSGRTGARLGVWLDGAGGYLRSGGADFDRDGVPDLLFTSRGGNPSRAEGLVARTPSCRVATAGPS